MRALPIADERGRSIRDRVEAEVRARIGDRAGAARAAQAAMDEEERRTLARGIALPPACGPGCSWCCHVHVDAGIGEILAAADHLRATRTEADLAALRDQLAAHAARVAALDDEARWAARIPCALLASDGRCSIHPARPLRCRAFHAWSADRCREAYEGTSDADPVPVPPLARAAAAVEEGYDRALQAAGIADAPHRFEVGLAIALADPDAGPEAFAAARS